VPGGKRGRRPRIRGSRNGEERAAGDAEPLHRLHGEDVRQPGERAGDQAGQHGEGQLERQSDEEDRLQPGSPRNRAGVQGPLDVLLDGETDERQEPERPGGERAAAAAARPQEESAGCDHDADGGQQRRSLQVVVTARSERVGALMRAREGHVVGDRVGRQPAQHGEREAEEPGDADTLHPAFILPAHSLNRLAASATTHCLTGCAIGEVLGLAIATVLDWRNLPSIVLAVGLAFLFGYSFTMVPLLRTGMALGVAVGLALAADTLSITVMELVDNAIVLVVPGAMDAGLADLLFWGSLVFALAVAWVAAFPVNRWLIARGRGHAVVHAHH
jgi:hypothetical protein